VWEEMYGWMIHRLQRGIILGEWGGTYQGEKRSGTKREAVVAHCHPFTPTFIKKKKIEAKRNAVCVGDEGSDDEVYSFLFYCSLTLTSTIP